MKINLTINGVSQALTQVACGDPSVITLIDNSNDVPQALKPIITARCRLNTARSKQVRTIRLAIPTVVKALNSDGVLVDRVVKNYADVKLSLNSGVNDAFIAELSDNIALAIKSIN